MVSRRLTSVLALSALVLLCSAAGALLGSASANSPIENFKAYPSTSQAGGHPNIILRARWGNKVTKPEPCDCNNAKDVEFNFPKGVIGNPHAVPYCSEIQFASAECPVDSQIGVSAFGLGMVPLYNLQPNSDQAGLVGLTTPLVHTPVFAVLSARTGSDYGLRVRIPGIVNLSLGEMQIKLWGTPASPANDGMRFHFHTVVCYGFSVGDQADVETWTQLYGHSSCETPEYLPIGSNSPEEPFLDNPTSCDQPLSTSVFILSYDKGTDETSVPWPPTTGCDQLAFNPSLYGQPTATATDSASGLDVDLGVPQTSSPTFPSGSELKATTTLLPQGMTINPNTADGKTTCSDVEARFGTEEEAVCPQFSRVGTVTLTSTALPLPIKGGIFLGDQKPGDPYRLVLTADGFATHVKLAGTVQADPETGRLAVTFPELPETPFSDFNLHFFGSERGLLATPTKCGTYPVTTTFVPWDQALPDHTSTQFFDLGSGPGGAPCPGASRPFSPSIRGGVAVNTAGTHSPFSIAFNRNDGDQNISTVSVATPPGFSASLVGVPYCSDSAIATASSLRGRQEQEAPSCPAASQVGTATVGAGAGDHPVYVDGSVYLAGPYKGAPISLAVITPAISGPYDLGTAVVRVAVNVDPLTAKISAVSDQLPRILQGIQLRLRSILVNLDRPNFAINPTSCDPFSVDANLAGEEGATAALAQRFQIANCASLPYEPKLGITLSGGVNRRGHPAIHALFTAQPGEANSKRISVTLPKGELLDNSHINNICTNVQFAAEACPENSVLGSAEATTPLLDQPLKGKVYLRASLTHKLPDLAIDLKGQIGIQLVGRIDSPHERYRTVFESVPDAPISSFDLKLAGGNKGLLQNSADLCGTHKNVVVNTSGQNGAQATQNTKLKVKCGGGARKKRHETNDDRENGGNR